MNKLLSFKSLLFFLFLLFVLLNLPVCISASYVKYKKTHDDNMESTNSRMQMYNQLHLQSFGLSEEAFDYAMRGFENLKHTGKIVNQHILSIIDFSKSSNEKRLFVVDVVACCVLFNTYVAHGRNSGTLYAQYFSNIPSSNQSSLGFYETTCTYIGKNGYSLILKGLEKGINDLADERSIVLHGAPYVSEGFIKTKGFLGRSLGCPAVPENLSKPIIDEIKNGTCLFIYANNRNYLNKSLFLRAS